LRRPPAPLLYSFAAVARRTIPPPPAFPRRLPPVDPASSWPVTITIPHLSGASMPRWMLPLLLALLLPGPQCPPSAGSAPEPAPMAETLRLAPVPRRLAVAIGPRCFRHRFDNALRHDREAGMPIWTPLHQTDGLIADISVTRAPSAPVPRHTRHRPGDGGPVGAPAGTRFGRRSTPTGPAGTAAHYHGRPCTTHKFSACWMRHVHGPSGTFTPENGRHPGPEGLRALRTPMEMTR
jgi:hypothetical protein